MFWLLTHFPLQRNPFHTHWEQLQAVLDRLSATLSLIPSFPFASFLVKTISVGVRWNEQAAVRPSCHTVNLPLQQQQIINFINYTDVRAARCQQWQRLELVAAIGNVVMKHWIQLTLQKHHQLG